MPREPAPLSGETTAHSEEDWFKPCYFNPWSQPFWLAKCHTCSCSLKIKNTNNSQLIKLTAPNMPTRIRYIPKSWPIKKPQAAPRHAIARFFPLDDDLLIWHVDPALEVVAQLTQGRRAREATNGVLLAMENPLSLSIYLSIDLSIYRSIDLSIDRSIDLSIYRSIDLSIYRSIDLSIYRSIDLSIYLSFYLSIYVSIYLSFYLSIYLSIIYLSIYLIWCF